MPPPTGDCRWAELRLLLDAIFLELSEECRKTSWPSLFKGDGIDSGHLDIEICGCK